MRNRSLWPALFAGVVIVASACTPAATTAPPTPPATGSTPTAVPPSETPTEPPPQYEALKIGVVTDVGQLEDKSFNQSSNEGAIAAAELIGGEHDVIVTAAISDYGANIQSFIDNDYDVIVTVGFLIGGDTAKAAKENPDITFIGVDQGICVDLNGDNDPTFACAGDAKTLLPNYQGIVFAEAQPGYLAGMVAATVSQSGTISAVGGTNVPAVVNYWRGYENGAHSINPNATVLYQETDPDPVKGFNDPTKGKAIAEQFIGQGADVLFQIAGLTGQGALEAACAANIYGIGVDVDQAESIPAVASCLLTSAEKKLKDTVQAVIVSRSLNAFQAGTVVYNAASTPPAIGLAPYHEMASMITADLQAKLDAAFQAFVAGTLDPCAPVKCTVSGS